MADTDPFTLWQRALAGRGPDPAYGYPLREEVTEPSEARQDPDKRMRERALIADELDFAWQAGLDLGCGVGANFDLFARAARRAQDAFLIGLDPDAGRAARAKERLQALDTLRGLVACGSAPLLASAPPALQVDAALVCQVLGHTAEADSAAILSQIIARLSSRGRILIAVPVVFPAAGEFDFAASWSGQEDLYHSVRPHLDPASPGFRTLIDAAGFDRAARQSPEGVLPVRAFLLPQLSADLSGLPLTLETAPASLRAWLPNDVDIRSQLYSIHARAPRSGLPAIGDALFTVSRTGD